MTLAASQPPKTARVEQLTLGQPSVTAAAASDRPTRQRGLAGRGCRGLDSPCRRGMRAAVAATRLPGGGSGGGGDAAAGAGAGATRGSPLAPVRRLNEGGGGAAGKERVCLPPGQTCFSQRFQLDGVLDGTIWGGDRR